MKGEENFNFIKPVFVDQNYFCAKVNPQHFKNVYDLLIDNDITNLIMTEKTEYLRERDLNSPEFDDCFNLQYLDISFVCEGKKYKISLELDYAYHGDCWEFSYGYDEEYLQELRKIREQNQKESSEKHEIIKKYYPKFYELYKNYDSIIKDLREKAKQKAIAEFIIECRRRQSES